MEFRVGSLDNNNDGAASMTCPCLHKKKQLENPRSKIEKNVLLFKVQMSVWFNGPVKYF